MYIEYADAAAESIKAVEGMIDGNERLRAIIFGGGAASGLLPAELASLYPSATRWKVFDHSAVITRLYAIYEKCINDLVRQWLSDLPAIVPDYGCLGSCFADAHRRGISQVLAKLGQRRLSKLASVRVGRDFTDAVGGAAGFAVLPEAFLIENKALRSERIYSLLRALTIGNVAEWVSVHPEMTRFVGQIRGGATTCESELKTLIDYRNDAAHGNVSDTLAAIPLRECALFVLALCIALAEKFEWSRLELLRRYRLLTSFGTVTEVFKRADAVVAVVSNATLSTGQRVFVHGERMCRCAKVLSIEIDDSPHDVFTASAPTEVGLRFDWLPQKGAELYDP